MTLTVKFLLSGGAVINPDRKGTGSVDKMIENGATVGKKPAGSGAGDDVPTFVEDASPLVTEKTL